MTEENGKTISIYLTDWQIRFVKDNFGIETHVLRVPFSASMRPFYLAPLPAPQAKRMYLADWQKAQIRDEIKGFGKNEDCEKAIDFVDLLDENLFKSSMTPLYDVPINKP